LRYLKSRGEAEEVAQDVFVKAYRSIANFKGTSKLSTWLYTISVTSSITFLRKKRVHFHSLDSEAFIKAFENIGGGIPANAIEQKTKVLMVTEAIQMLTPQDAVILSLFMTAY
jgi:RNA polymerase sigma-70 factor (ECF subfamily)